MADLPARPGARLESGSPRKEGPMKTKTKVKAGGGGIFAS
jgi:hypothetical protein